MAIDNKQVIDPVWLTVCAEDFSCSDVKMIKSGKVLKPRVGFKIFEFSPVIKTQRHPKEWAKRITSAENFLVPRWLITITKVFESK